MNNRIIYFLILICIYFSLSNNESYDLESILGEYLYETPDVSLGDGDSYDLESILGDYSSEIPDINSLSKLGGESNSINFELDGKTYSEINLKKNKNINQEDIDMSKYQNSEYRYFNNKFFGNILMEENEIEFQYNNQENNLQLEKSQKEENNYKKQNIESETDYDYKKNNFGGGINSEFLIIFIIFFFILLNNNIYI